MADDPGLGGPEFTPIPPTLWCSLTAFGHSDLVLRKAHFKNTESDDMQISSDCAICLNRRSFRPRISRALQWYSSNMLCIALKTGDLGYQPAAVPLLLCPGMLDTQLITAAHVGKSIIWTNPKATNLGPVPTVYWLRAASILPSHEPLIQPRKTCITFSVTAKAP